MFNANNEYLGGSISPGIAIRFKALNNFTNGLPLVEASNHQNLYGKSTIDCINTGVLNGFCHEINGTIEANKDKYEDLEVILCGGNTDLFESNLNTSIFVQPDLVLYGLNRIIEYNAG